MPRPALATLACLPPDCPHVGRPGPGQLAIRKVYGTDHIRLLRGYGCQAEFSERRNTALCNTTVRQAKAEAIMDHLDEGCSVRATARRTTVAKGTVARLLKTRGRHAQRFHAQEVHDLQPRARQCAEHWSWVQPKQKTCRPAATPQAGDFWDHTAMAPDSTVIVALGGGKRTQEQTPAWVSDTPSRVRRAPLPALCSDGYEGYAPAIREACGRRSAVPTTGFKGRPRLDSMRGPQG
jgi:hypothetical protein